MKKVIILIIAISLVSFIGWGLYYLNTSKLTFSIEPQVVNRGSGVLLVYHAVRVKSLRECEYSGAIRSVTNSDNEEMLLHYEDIADNFKIKSLQEVNQMAGFLDKGTYNEIVLGRTFIVEGLGCQFGLGDADPSWQRWFKAWTARITGTGQLDEVVVLPATPVGEYRLTAVNQKFTFRVQ